MNTMKDATKLMLSSSNKAQGHKSLYKKFHWQKFVFQKIKSPQFQNKHLILIIASNITMKHDN